MQLGYKGSVNLTTATYDALLGEIAAALGGALLRDCGVAHDQELDWKRMNKSERRRLVTRQRLEVLAPFDDARVLTAAERADATPING